MQSSNSLARLSLETSWANQIIWYTALVVNFCFEGVDTQHERASKTQQWQQLWDLVQTWSRERPTGFDPVFEGQASANSVFPEIYFTADWHGAFAKRSSIVTSSCDVAVLSFVYYQFACILLLSYQPSPEFGLHNSRRVSDINVSASSTITGRSNFAQHQILPHAQAICGACKSSPEAVPLSITVCHTVFLWGPLLIDLNERNELLQLLIDLENNHVWPTTWIINALKRKWGIEALM